MGCHKVILASFASIVMLSGSGCSSSPVVSGAALGTASGAAAGALVGSAIANGDVVASALLGGAIGLPVGIYLGMRYQANEEAREQERLYAKYLDNQDKIREREKELEQLRDELLSDAPPSTPADPSLQRRLYMGPTLGVPTR